MPTLDEIVASIDARLRAAQDERDVLTRARQELVAADGAHRRGKPTAARRARPPRRRARRAADAVSPDSLHALLAAEDGLSTPALAQRANADAAGVLAVLRAMETSGRVRRTGERRATRWHAVDGDEAWVTRRAAELAAQATSA